MIEFSRYPHVKNLIEYYLKTLNRPDISVLMQEGVSSEDDAKKFSKFIWEMLDQMATDIENKTAVLGNVDNSSMIPDIDYEVSLYLAESGFEEIWNRVCDEN